MSRLSLPLLLVTILVAGHPSLAAETRYVTDQLVVTVRSGPGLDAEAVTSVKTGTPLEIIEDQGRFVRVRTPDGSTGYALGQYLTPAPPAAVQVSRLETERDDLLQQVRRLEEARSQGAAVTPAPPSGPSAEELAAAAKERQQLQAENARLTAELETLRQGGENPLLRPEMIRWFLAGGAVFLVGWLTGKISRKKSRSF